MEVEVDVDHLNNWHDVYESFKRFSRCDDGLIAEGYSDAMTKLLANKWEEFGGFVRLATRDKNFRRFVIRHVDETVPTDRLQLIAKNARNHCPVQSADLCKQIIAAASK